MNLRFGYNTNGFGHHRLNDALVVIAGCGYDGVALTLDVHHCDPFNTDASDLRRLKGMLKALQLSVVIETGARFLLSKWFKHEPTLICKPAAGRDLRQQFLRRAVDIAAELEAEAVSLWSGPRQPDVSEHDAWKWLVEGCCKLSDYATRRGIVLGFEPEPGMLVDSLATFDRLKAEVPSPAFGLTLDIGHVFVTEKDPIATVIHRYAHLIRNIHIEDMKTGVHEHRMFGEGDVNFPPVLRALSDVAYKGLVNVELSRDSYRAPDIARRSLQLLKQWSAKGQASAIA
ncbi:MAG: sugar phosphate isomerase/epimerase [Verrucomicrobiae bacterium]|nr:sugar phosphate isomerase/epimerase [Verrucomicrobiae bacterium]